MESTDFQQTAAMWERIEARCDELRLSVNAIGGKATGNRDTVRNIQRAVRDGRSYNPRRDTLQKIASALGVQLLWLLYGTGEKLLDPDLELISKEVGSSSSAEKRVKRGGKVEGGAFRPVDLDPEGDEFVSVAPDPRFPLAQQYAWEVVGDSMDAVGIEPGMTILGVDLHDYDRYYSGLRDGQYVVVRVLRDSGRESALTVKEVRIYRDRMELVPHSRRGKHETISIKNDYDPDGGGDQYDILAIVLDARHQFV